MHLCIPDMNRTSSSRRATRRASHVTAAAAAATAAILLSTASEFAFADDGEDCDICPCRFVPPNSRGASFKDRSTCLEYEDADKKECIHLAYVFRCVDGFTTLSTTETTTPTSTVTTSNVHHCGQGQRKSVDEPETCLPCRPVPVQRGDKECEAAWKRLGADFEAPGDDRRVEIDTCGRKGFTYGSDFCSSFLGPKVCPFNCVMECQQATYQDVEEHQDAECKTQPAIVCRRNEYVDSGSLQAAQSCKPCPVGLHLPQDQHTQTTCRATTSTATTTTTATTTRGRPCTFDPCQHNGICNDVASTSTSTSTSTRTSTNGSGSGSGDGDVTAPTGTCIAKDPYNASHVVMCSAQSIPEAGGCAYSGNPKDFLLACGPSACASFGLSMLNYELCDWIPTAPPTAAPPTTNPEDTWFECVCPSGYFGDVCEFQTTTTTTTNTETTSTATSTTTTETTTTTITTTTQSTTTTTTIRCEFCINPEGGDCIDPNTRLCVNYLDPTTEECFPGFVDAIDCLASTGTSTATSIPTTPTTVSRTPRTRGSTVTSTVTSTETNTATTVTSTATSTGTTSGTTITSTATSTAISTRTTTAVTTGTSTAESTPTTVSTTATTTPYTTATSTPITERKTTPSTTPTTTPTTTAATVVTSTAASTHTTTAETTATTTNVGCGARFEFGNGVEINKCIGPRHEDSAAAQAGASRPFTGEDIDTFCWRPAGDEWSDSFDLEYPIFRPPLQTAPGQMYKLVGVTGGGETAEIRIVYDGSGDDDVPYDDDDDTLSTMLGKEVYTVSIATLRRVPPNNWSRDQKGDIERNVGRILTGAANRRWQESAAAAGERTQLLSLTDLSIESLDEYTGCFVAVYTPVITGTFDARCRLRDELETTLDGTLQEFRERGLQFVNSGASVSLVHVTTTTALPTTVNTSVVTKTSITPTGFDFGDSTSGDKNAEPSSSMITIVLISAIVLIVLSIGFAVLRSSTNAEKEREGLANREKARRHQEAMKQQQQAAKTKMPTRPTTQVPKASNQQVPLALSGEHTQAGNRNHNSLQSTPKRSSVRNPTLPRPEKKKKVKFNPEKPTTLVGDTSIFGHEGSKNQSKAIPKKTKKAKFKGKATELPITVVTLSGMTVNAFDDMDDLGETSF